MMMKHALSLPLFVLLAAATPLSTAFVVQRGGPAVSSTALPFSTATTSTTQLFLETPATPATTTKTFPFSEEQLIAKAKDFIYNASAFFGPPDESMFADDFVFRGPVVGPLNKKDYLFTLGECFQIFKAFPDISPNAWGFSIDPENPARVWFMVRITGTFENDWTLVPGLYSIPHNGKRVQGAPETYSVLFNDEMLVKCLTVGYVADRFEGNTEGLGAAFGMLRAVGFNYLPRPPNPLYRIFNVLTNGIKGNPKAFSTEVPAWWPHEGKLDD